MNPGHRNSPVRWIIVLAVVALACAPAATVDSRSDLDRAVALYVAGDYRHAAERLEEVARDAGDDVARREAFTYLGRSYIALGDTQAAIDAFTLGVQYGDQGPCVEYLEVLKRYQEGSPEGLHILETITRGELAGAAVRVLGDGKPLDPTGPTPIEMAEQRGWLPVLPDGREHADAAVTRAALYAFVGQVLADAGLPERTDEVMPGGYRAAMNDPTPVSGRDAIVVLERVRALKEKNGR
jgi:tetratricopeptide (TPR) repeat protein